MEELKLTATEWVAYNAPTDIFTNYIPMIIIIAMLIFFTIVSIVAEHTERFEKYGSKKFLVAISMAVGAFFLTWIGKMDGNSCSWVFAIVSSGYGVLNMLEHKAQRVKDLSEFDDDQLSRKFIVAMTIIGFTLVLANYDHMLGNSIMISLGIAGGLFGFTNVKSKTALEQILPKSPASKTK